VRILIVDDDVPVAKFVSALLTAEHHESRMVAVSEASRIIPQIHTDLVILDKNVSGAAGMEILRLLRSTRPHLPILVLTGSEGVEDCVKSLDAGADDYLNKPFVPAELSARVRALLRRSKLPFEPLLRNLDLELDRVRRVVSRKGREIRLTPKEFGLLECLMLNAGREVTRSAIINDVWKLSSEASTNIVDVYVNYLRRKIDAGGPQSLIQTVRGTGYRIGPNNDTTQ
jgi:DNA-binding response OmpR family regulator